jgi:hypothetical protein
MEPESSLPCSQEPGTSLQGVFIVREELDI